MAKASKDLEVRTRTIDEKVPVVRLVLDTDEAAALVQVLRTVGGDRFKGGRVLTDKVLTALQSHANVKPASYELQGSLYFGKPGLFGDTASYVTSASVW